MNKLLLLSGLLVAAFSSAQINLNESFEAGSTPAGFTNVSFFPSKTITPCTGSYGLLRGFYSGGTAGSTTYSSSASNGGKLDISFRYKTHIYNGGSVNGTLKVEYSADGGQTFQTLQTITLNAVIACTTWTGTLAEGTVPANANFRFRVSGQWTSGDYNVILDDFKITQSAASLATNDIAENNSSVYPNPVQNVLNISNVSNVRSITITDFSGRSIQTIRNVSDKIDLSALRTGNYILTIEYNSGKKSQQKLIKK